MKKGNINLDPNTSIEQFASQMRIKPAKPPEQDMKALDDDPLSLGDTAVPRAIAAQSDRPTPQPPKTSSRPKIPSVFFAQLSDDHAPHIPLTEEQKRALASELGL